VPGNETDLYLLGVQARLAEAQLDAGLVAKSESTATQALARSRKVLPAHSLRLGAPLYALARIKLAQGHADEAEPLLREALAVRSPPHPAGDLRVLEIQVDLARALSASGKRDEAQTLMVASTAALAKSSSPYATDLRERLSSIR